jgi:CheY-like chemotaxis protein
MSRILVVDDEPHIRYLVSSILDKLGYEAIEAHTADHASSIIKQTSPIDLVITDLMLPEIDGIELMETIKRDYPTIPVMVVSAYPAMLEEACDRGADYSLQKPFSKNQLVQMVRQSLPPAM